MTIKRLHNLVLSRCGQSGAYQDLTNVEIDERLNEAQRHIVEYYRQFSDSQTKKDIEAPFIVLDEKVKFEETSEGLSSYFFSFKDLKQTYVHLDKITFVCSNNTGIVDITDLDSLSYKLNDAHQKPSELWNRVLGVIADNGVYLYADQEIDTFYVSYMRMAKDVFYGNYDSVEYIACVNEANRLSQPTEQCDIYYKNNGDPVTSEFSEHYQHLLIDVAVYLITGQTKNSIVYQLTQNKLQQLDNKLLN